MTYEDHRVQSHRAGFTPYPLNRAALLRKDPERVAGLLRRSGTRLYPVWEERNLVTADPPDGALGLPIEAWGELAAAADSVILLGVDGSGAHFALGIDETAATAVLAGCPPGRFQGLRQLAGILGDRDGALLAHARAMVHWHRSFGFCGWCGAPTRSEEAGYLRVCTAPGCGRQHFPRTDPAVIVAVTFADELLLARQAQWPTRMHSVLAGFVEPGECLEDAVAREILEEAGIEVGSVSYFGSQPWPFPGSLMVGFRAEALTCELDLGDDELESACWVSRAELRHLAGEGDLTLPAPFSISFRLIEDWYDREEPGALSRLPGILERSRKP